jgi:purine-binding chemotaxis protein CheW
MTAGSMTIKMPPAPGRVSDILRARARKLARPLGRREAGGNNLEIVEFGLAKELYAVEHTYVRDVLRLENLTPLPCTPHFVRGIINVRGQILPVIDIKRFFDLPDVGITDLHRVIVVQFNRTEMGILADTVTAVRSIPRASVQASLPTLTGIRAAYLRGVTDDHVVILDASKILMDPKLMEEEESPQ